MISWIQVTFAKHTKFVFAFLLVVITIPFVFTIGASPGIGGGRRVYKEEFFGHDLGSVQVHERVVRDAAISVGLRIGYFMPAGDPRMLEFARIRLASLYLADQYRLAEPGQSQLVEFIKTLRPFQDEQGQFDPKRYADFADQLKTNPQFGAADVNRVLVDDFRIKRLDELLGGPGFTLPGEIAGQLAAAATRWTLRVAEFDLAAYHPEVKIDDVSLLAFFERNASAYELTPQASVDYVVFKAATFTGNDPLDDNAVVAHFEANKARFPKPSADPAKPSLEPADLATVRPQVEASLRLEQATRRAAAEATNFAYALFDQKVPLSSPTVDQLVARHRGERATAPLFTETTPPAGLSWTRQIASEAFRLTASRYFSDPLPLGSDLVVLLWKETLPARKLLLAEVRDRVVADYTAETKRQMLVDAGRLWRRTLETRLAAGTPFEAAVADLAGAPQAVTKAFGPFTLRQPPEGLDRTVMASLDRTVAGGVTDLLLGDAKGFLVQVVAKTTPPVDPAAPDYAAVRASLAAYSANATQSAAITELVEAERRRNEPPRP